MLPAANAAERKAYFACKIAPHSVLFAFYNHLFLSFRLA